MNLLERLKHEILLLDGAMGTMLGPRLEKEGYAYKNYTQANYLHGYIVEQIHREYINAGADIITTNTLTGSGIKLQEALDETFSEPGKESEMPDETIVEIFNAEAFERAKSARNGKNVFIAGSLGPLGKFIKREGYNLGLSPEEATRLFLEQGRALEETDFFLIETMYDVVEAMHAVAALKEFRKPIAVSYSLESGKTVYGDSIERITTACEKAGVDIIGINCINGIKSAIAYARELSQHTKLPLLVYPNAGKPDKNNAFPESPEYMAKKLPELLEIENVRIVGGCCGTTPQHIQAFRKVLDSYQ